MEKWASTFFKMMGLLDDARAARAQREMEEANAKPGTSKASKVINAASAKAMMDAALEEERLFMLLNRTSNPIPILQIPYCYATKNVHIFIKISAQK